MIVGAVVGWIRRERFLFSLLCFAFLLRIAGIGYGLPLLLVSDEPPFTLGALKMLQLKTLIPAIYPEAFQTILYYPVYGSYLLLIPFTVIIGAQYLFFSGGDALFQAHLISDLSPFIMTARIISVAVGVASVYLTYRIAETWFRSHIAALAAAFLLATSLIHMALSMVGRNWIFASVIFLSVLFVLTRPGFSLNKRYMLAFVIAGVGMGFHPFSLFALIMAGLYYLVFDVRAPRQIAQDAPHMFLSAALFGILAAVSFFLWHGGNNFFTSITLFQDKSLLGLITSPWTAVSRIAYSEPVLVACFIAGLAALFATYRKLVLFVVLWCLIYVSIFYMLFRFDPRFMLPLVPLFAIMAGYLVHRLWHQHIATVVIAALLLASPLISSIRVAQLAYTGEPREHALQWIAHNVSPGEKVLVFSRGMRVPTTAEAVRELRAVDPGALRVFDEVDEQLDRTDVPHVLNNVASITAPDFFGSLPEYVRLNGYTYIVVEPSAYFQVPGSEEIFAEITARGILVEKFSGMGEHLSISNSSFMMPLHLLFQDKLLGSDVLIYHVP